MFVFHNEFKTFNLRFEFWRVTFASLSFQTSMHGDGQKYRSLAEGLCLVGQGVSYVKDTSALT